MRTGDQLLLMVNGATWTLEFTLPPGRWRCELDTSAGDGSSRWHSGDTTQFMLKARSLVLLVDRNP